MKTAVFGRTVQKVTAQMAPHLEWVEVSIVVADEVQDDQEAYIQ